jgi:hypothetical protein
MPLSNSEARSHSVLETSLTELAFIFFFILAIFASWKISDTTEELSKQETISNELSDQISVLNNTLAEVTKFANLVEEYDPTEIVMELSKGKEAIINLDKAKEKQKILEAEVEKYSALIEEYDPTEIVMELSKGKEAIINLDKAQEKQKILEAEVEKYSALIGDKPNFDFEMITEKMNEFEKIKEIFTKSTNGSDGSVTEQIRQLKNSMNDMSGQNSNLRNKLEALGNGLDHPPCWANPMTGDVEYIFDIVINEASLAVYKGWPESRNEQAKANNNITKVIGEYRTNTLLWRSTSALFKESKLQKCRHFARVYDHSDSKAAFKSYLRGIENHFYKYLSSSRYE